MFSSHINRPTLLWATKTIQLVVYYAGKLFFSFARVEVRRGEIIRRFHGNAVFAANHASELDLVVLCLALEKIQNLRGRLPLIVLSREKEYYNDMGFVKATLYGGALFRILGGYPVTPKEQRTAETRHNTIATYIALLKEGRSVIIFPEGTITHTGNLSPAKPGVAILSAQSGRPVIPMAIEGTFGLSFTDFLFGRKHVRVTFGHPIFPLSAGVEHSDFSPKKSGDRAEEARLVMLRIRVMLAHAKERK